MCFGGESMIEMLLWFFAAKSGSDSSGLILLIPIAIFGYFGGKKVFNWLTKKKIKLLEEKKWLKITLSTILGVWFGVIICVFGIVALIFRSNKNSGSSW